MKKAVVLLSGGMDSAVCLAIAAERDYVPYTLTFDYGQKNRFEIEAAARLSKMIGAREHMKMDIGLGKFGGSALTDDIDVPAEESEGVPVTYVPARNLVFLSLAAAWAEVIGAGAVFIGVNMRDYSGYPDCRREFIKSFEKTAGLGTREETDIVIETPLIEMKKSEIYKEGLRLKIDFSMTSSCYDPLPGGSECGKCDSCRIRQKGIEEAGI
ncbi:MAG: 7-cyano-7-deazaguanine synthase QueC [Elusimicrobiota bacterium]